MVVYDPFAPTSLREIYAQIRADVAALESLGTQDEPVEMDRRPQTHILYALRHLHINGKCVKNKTGVFCD